MKSHALLAITGRLTDAVLMLDQRRKRWANIKTALVKRPMFAGLLLRDNSLRLNVKTTSPH